MEIGRCLWLLGQVRQLMLRMMCSPLYVRSQVGEGGISLQRPLGLALSHLDPGEPLSWPAVARTLSGDDLEEVRSCLRLHRKAVDESEELLRMHADVVQILGELEEMGSSRGLDELRPVLEDIRAAAERQGKEGQDCLDLFPGNPFEAKSGGPEHQPFEERRPFPNAWP